MRLFLFLMAGSVGFDLVGNSLYELIQNGSLRSLTGGLYTFVYGGTAFMYAMSYAERCWLLFGFALVYAERLTFICSSLT